MRACCGKRPLRHRSAVILCGELDPESAINVAKSEFEALQVHWNGGLGPAVRELQTASSKDGTLRRLRPDLLAEAFLLLDEDLSDGRAVRRMGIVSPKPLAEMLILTARDFARSDEIPLAWLESFQEGGQGDFDVLTEIDAAIPPQTEVRLLALALGRVAEWTITGADERAIFIPSA